MPTFRSIRTLACTLALGFVAAVAGAGGPYVFYSVTPCRILDTRSGPALISGTQYNYQVHGLCGVPSTAKAATLNLTAVSPTAGGFVSLYPYPGPFPGISTINVNAGEPAIANGAIVPLGTTPYQLSAVYGTCCGGSTHIILDVTGYFQEP